MTNHRMSVAIAASVVALATVVGSTPAVAGRAEPAPAATYTHPGLLNSQSSLDELKTKANSTTPSAMRTGYQGMLDERFADPAYPHRAYSTVVVAGSTSTPSETQFKEDAQAAYAHALRWVKTGHQVYRDKSVAILDAWSGEFQEMVSSVPGETWPQQWLEAAWYAPMWANAAEIIRDYDDGAAGWPTAMQDRFDGFLDELAVLAESAYRENNWGASSGLALMAVGVYQDDSVRYEEGKRRILQLLPFLVRHTGEVFELAARDCWHPQYSLAAITQAAEIARNQGDSSIYDFAVSGDPRPRLAMGLEYMSRSIVLGEGVRDCRAYDLRGFGEIGARWYVADGVAVPTLEQAVKAARPDTYWATFTSWATATHGSDGF
jgi:hypothetical protein